MSKLVIVSTWNDENAERATLPWVMATAGVATDQEVMIFLQGPAVVLATKGGADGIQAEPFPPISELIAAYLEGGGVIKCCGPCLAGRKIAPSDLIEGAEVVGAAYLIEQMKGASVISY